MPLHGNVLFEKDIQKNNLLIFVADRIVIRIRDTGALCFEEISAEDVTLFLLKQTYKSLFPETMDVYPSMFFSGWQ